MSTERSRRYRAAYVWAWLAGVALPLASAAAAWLWIEVCKAMFIPGMLLALPAFVVQVGLTYYAAPLRWLAPELCFTPSQGVVPGLPCDTASWVALGALYSCIGLGLVAAAHYVTGPERQ
jgi:hypothetical protein